MVGNGSLASMKYPVKQKSGATSGRVTDCGHCPPPKFGNFGSEAREEVSLLGLTLRLQRLLAFEMQAGVRFPNRVWLTLT